MGRRSQTKTLNIWMNGSHAGIWSITPSGEHRLTYTQSWLDSPQVRPISLSLPLQPSRLYHRGDPVRYFFDNLLPDSEAIRRHIQSRFGTASGQAFDLLFEIGRDCVGAIQLLPEDMEPSGLRTINGRSLSASEIETQLKSVMSNGPLLGDKEDFRISISGAQEKHTLLFHNNEWLQPIGATPSTHIIKLPLGEVRDFDMSTSVENEWLCMQILKEYGLPAAECSMHQFGSLQTLVVKRFDRNYAQDGSWIIRLPQEDFCQITGTPSWWKYESDGGPGMVCILDYLLSSNDSMKDRAAFLKAQILFWLLGAIDGHAKNFSVYLQKQNSFQLTPFYDVLSAYPVMGSGGNAIHPKKVKMAMAVSGESRHYQWAKIRRDHWFTTAAKAGITKQSVQNIIDDIIEKTPVVLEKVKLMIPSGFPEQIADSIINGLQDTVKKLEI